MRVVHLQREDVREPRRTLTLARGCRPYGDSTATPRPLIRKLPLSVITMSVPSTAPASLGANVTANFVLPPGSTASGSSSIALGWNDETSVVTDRIESVSRASVLNTVTSASDVSHDAVSGNRSSSG